MGDSIETIHERVNKAIEEKIGCSTSLAGELSSQIVLAMASHEDSDELKTLNYRWQTFLTKQYIEQHNIDEFLESLVQRVLQEKTNHPLKEMILFLEKEEPDNEQI
ncbi:hypothetical protein AGDE_03161 [Angomonas deanei]|uniref:Uncharacterized protein n=1 Tax=Angomonas deanei TaxID=59799 RepID=S9VDV1_9TRYP|nr:hypothetical protein AGDE_04800 [Angomonas deanei]EPY40766.1 hypothetical protein AGDE_03161 [Angomonas deanei]CAD2214327.1 hypothetical protein, conserved [Angomonas deanei]|eukprot:EPY39129.1 hypothetical protein AGDE_04800 [Angomonas deanei]